MAKKSTKHRSERVINYADLGGGLNLSVSEESIADNELSQAENWEYSFPTGKLTTREGLTLVKDLGVSVDTLFYADNLGFFLFSSGATLYKLVGDTTTNIGTLSSTDAPNYTLWGDMVLIASGGTLQSYDGTTLDDTGSLDTSLVFTRVGRVVIVNGDTLHYSGVGDEENWTVGSDSDAIEIQAGYKDGGEIISVIPLATDVVVFKSSGSIFRIAGEYPDWAMYEITRSQTALTRFSTVQNGNNVYFLSPTGFMSLLAVQEYGNVKTSEEGYKINTALAESADSGAKVWSLPSKGQIWVRPETSEYVWVYHTFNNAWTKFKMSGTVTAHTSLDNGSNYIIIGTSLYLIEGDTDNGSPFVCNMKAKKFVARDDFIIKRVSLEYFRHTEAVGSVTLGQLSLSFNILSSGDIAYSDDDIAYSDTDPLAEVNVNKLDKRASYRTEFIEPFIQLQSGSITIKNIKLNIVEV